MVTENDQKIIDHYRDVRDGRNMESGTVTHIVCKDGEQREIRHGEDLPPAHLIPDWIIMGAG